MEACVCPICGAKNLMESNVDVKTISEKRIVCQNERYSHIRIGLVDLLIKSEKAKRDEEDEEALVPA